MGTHRIPEFFSRVQRAIAFAQIPVAFATILITLPVFLGWTSGAAITSGWLLPWAPMQYNTALAIVWGAIALVAQVFDRRAIYGFFSALVFTMGALTLLEHLTHLNFGIDELFHAGINAVYAAHPGRMAFNTSVSLTFLGLGLLLLSPRQSSQHRTMWSVLSASVSAILGSVTLLGFIFNFENTPSIVSFARTAIPTATGLAVLGIFASVRALFMLRDSDGEASELFVPTLSTVILMFFSTIGWQYSLGQQANSIRDAVEATVHKTHENLSESFKQIEFAMARYAARVELLGTQNRKFLELDSQNYLKGMPVIARIGLTDRDFQVVWSYPADIRHQVKGFNQSFDETRKAAFEKARDSRKPSLSRTVELRSGGYGNILPVALFQNDRFIGSIYASLQTPKIFGTSLRPEDFFVTVKEKSKVIFQQKGSTFEVDKFSSRFDFDWGLEKWEVIVTPTEAYCNSHSSNTPEGLFVMSLIFSALLGLLLRSAARLQKERLLLAEREKNSLERLELALESAQVGAWSIDLKTGQIWLSKHHHRIFGYETAPSTWNQDVFLMHVVPEDRERILKHQKTIIDGGASEHIQLRIRRADNQELRWVMVVPNLVRDLQGRPSRLVGIVRDIHEESMRTEREKRDLEWKKALLDHATYSIISTDPTGVIQTFNAAAENMLGYQAEELIGKFTPAIIHDLQEVQARSEKLSRELGSAVAPGFETFVAKVRATGMTDESDWSYVRKDGTRFPVSLSITSLKNTRGEITGYLGVAADLTERKKAEEALRATHARLVRVIESSGEGIWERDFDSSELSFIDAQARRILDFSDNEWVTYEELQTRIATEDRPLFLQSIANSLAKIAEGADVELRLEEKASGGNTRWIRSRATIVRDAQGRPLRIIATLKDITAEVEARKNLEKARFDAEAADRAKSEFLATMSHEIRTPLNGVIGMSNLLLDTSLNEDQQELARTVVQSGKTLLNLINDVLDFSKIEAGRMSLEEVEFDPKRTLQDMLKPFEHLAQKKGIQFSTEIPDSPTLLVGDSARIGQVMANLVSNALKFTLKGGVKVRVEQIANGDTTDVKIAVSDTGIGIPEDAKKRMFEAFSQAEHSTARKFGGSGLGLSISKRLVQLMGGTIGFDSIHGVGTTFNVFLTLKTGKRIEKDGDSASSRARIDSKRGFGDARVLVAEDIPTNQMVIGRMLDKLGCKHHFVANGNEVLDAMRETNFDLILMDCQMPEMDGYEATRMIRKSKTLNSTIPILALTANAVSGDEGKCREAGMNGYLSKPIDMKVLERALKEHLMKDTYIDPAIIPQFDALNVDGMPDLLVETIDSFLNTTPARVKIITESAEKGDFEHGGREAHALKSSSYMLGARSLGALCQAIEHQRTEKNLEKFQSDAKTLVGLYEATCRELSELKTLRLQQAQSKKSA